MPRPPGRITDNRNNARNETCTCRTEKNSDKQERFELQKRSRDKVVMEEGREAMTDKMIDRLIYRRMWDSDRAWKTAEAVWDGVKSLKFKYEKVAARQDNIQMHYLGMRRDDAQTNW